MKRSPLAEQQSSAGREFDSSTTNSGSSSSIQTEPVSEFSIFIERINPILNEIRDSSEIADLPAMQKAIDSLETDYDRAKSAMSSQEIQSSPAKHIEYLTQNLGRSLGLVLFASRDVAISNKQKIEALCKEMMNVRFELSSDRESEFAIEAEDEEESETEDETDEHFETEIVEEEGGRISTVDDAISEIRNSNEEIFRIALLALNGFIMDGVVPDDRIINEDVVKVLSNRLSTCKGDERMIIIQTLRKLSLQNDQHKITSDESEKMKGLEFLSALVKSMTRDVEEQREAVGLLLALSEDSGVRRRIGRIRGSIVMLVAISNGDNPEASHDARVLLNAMSGNTQHALHMAEAGYFKPLVKYLKEGSEMSKVLMATALSRLQLTDQNRASLGEDGAIEPLVQMFNTGNLEAKLSALNALESLSNFRQNIQHLIDSNIVAALLQLLFSVTSVLMTLREPASAILAKVAQSESIVLVKQDVAQQMLSLLNLTSPVIQNHLLEALNSIVSHPRASKVRRKMKENGAIQLLLPFFTENDCKIRTGALRLVHALSEDTQEQLAEQLDQAHIHIVADIASNSNSVHEKVAALGILSNLPVSDRKITDTLKKANLLPLMVSIIASKGANPTVALAEVISGVLIRFTVPTDRKLQHYSAENGVIPVLINLLSINSQTAKRNAALSLSQLSQNSLSLSKSRKLKWLCVPPSPDAFCEVHDGYCTAKSTFCLIRARAIAPLIRVLEGEERGADEAVLSCLSTLLHDDIWENGSVHLAGKSAAAVPAIVRVLAIGSLKAREKAVWILERIFRVESCREEYGESAQVVLIETAQKGDPVLKPAVAKLLAQLELLQYQSSYF